MAQLGGGDGRVAPSHRRCAMLARPVKRAASAASVSLNGIEISGQAGLARQDTLDQANSSQITRVPPRHSLVGCSEGLGRPA